MARKTFQGYSLTSLREWARDLKIAGRSKMSGDELVAACKAANFAQVQAMEQAVLPGVKLGALLRHKGTGDIIRVTSGPTVWEPYGTLYITADYVECDGWGDARRAERAAYENECNTHRTDAPHHLGVRHPLFQYETV